VLIWYQPSSSISLMTSRIFIAPCSRQETLAAPLCRHHCITYIQRVKYLLTQNLVGRPFWPPPRPSIKRRAENPAYRCRPQRTRGAAFPGCPSSTTSTERLAPHAEACTTNVGSCALALRSTQGAHDQLYEPDKFLTNPSLCLYNSGVSCLQQHRRCVAQHKEMGIEGTQQVTKLNIKFLVRSRARRKGPRENPDQ
jgi:hypothetical protein